MNLQQIHDVITQTLKKHNLEAHFKVLKTIKFEPEIVFSFNIFRMDNPYKDDIKYTLGLQNLMDVLPKKFNCAMRVYIDDSFLGKDGKWSRLYKNLESHRNVELIHFTFPQFKASKVFHDNVFSAIPRIIPVFDWSPKYKKETVIVLDVDYTEGGAQPRLLESLELMQPALRKVDLIFDTYRLDAFLIDTRLKFQYITDNFEFIHRLIMQPTGVSKRLSPEPFIELMDCMIHRCASYQDWLKTFVSGIDCKSKQIGSKELSVCNALNAVQTYGAFVFGLDEFLLNHYILKDILAKKLDFALLTSLPMMHEYHYFLYQYWLQKKITSQFMHAFYKAMLGNDYNPNLQASFEQLDPKVYIKQYKVKRENHFHRFMKDKFAAQYHKKIYDWIRSNQKLIMSSLRVPNVRDYKMYFSLVTRFPFDAFIKPKSLYHVRYTSKKNEYKLDFMAALPV